MSDRTEISVKRNLCRLCNRRAEIPFRRGARILYPGTHREHYDVCASKRREAIRHGAREVDTLFLVGVRRRKRAAELAAELES